MVVNLKWCCKQKEGIKLIESNENLSLGYIQMAEKAIGTMTREKDLNLQFAISACYYSMYYSLYSILMKVGIKCEIHSCSLEFMKNLLTEFYSKEDIDLIKTAFNTRNISQYYVDKIVSEEDTKLIFSKAQYFIDKSKSILSKLNEKNIADIRKQIEKLQSNKK